MNTNNLQKKYKKLLIFLSLILFVSSVLIREYVDFTFFRLMGVFSVIVFFCILYLLHKQRISYLLAFFFCLNIISGTLFVWFEFVSVPTLIISIHSISILTLILYLLPKLRGSLLGIKQLVGYAILTLAFGLFLYFLLNEVHQLDPYNSNEYYVGLIVYSIFLIFFTFSVFLYNHKKKSKASLVFMAFWFLFVFSNITYAVGYYKILFGDSFVYLSRLLLLMSLSFLIHYTVLNEKEKPKDSIRYI